MSERNIPHEISGKKHYSDSKRIRKALVTGGLVASGAVAGYEVGRHTATSHILDSLPNKIEQHHLTLLPGLELSAQGISVMVDYKQKKLRLPNDRVVKIELPYRNEKPTVAFDAQGLNHATFAPELYADTVHRYALRDIPSLVFSDFTFRNGRCQWESPMDFSVTDRKGEKVFESREISIRHEALGVVDMDKNILVLADIPKKGNYERMAANLAEASNLAKTVNAFMETFRKKDRLSLYHGHVERILLYQPIDARNEKPHSYWTSYEKSLIRGSNQELENRQLFLAGILHELGHFIAASVGSKEKEKIQAAFIEFRRLAGHDPDESLVGIFGAAEGTDGNPVYRILDESDVFNLYASTGHPFENPHEMFASLVAGITFAPDRVEALLGQLPAEQQHLFRTSVIRPCLDVFGKEWGTKILGDSYNQFY